MDDSDALDALTSKFARTSDIYTQKVLNTVLKLKRVDAPTFVDKMNACEKIGLIEESAKMIQVRDLRNEISHEYWMDQLREYQVLTLEFVPILARNIEVTREYLEKEGFLPM
jgi:hypothetical protein